MAHKRKLLEYQGKHSINLIFFSRLDFSAEENLKNENRVNSSAHLTCTCFILYRKTSSAKRFLFLEKNVFSAITIEKHFNTFAELYNLWLIQAYTVEAIVASLADIFTKKIPKISRKIPFLCCPTTALRGTQKREAKNNIE